VEERKKRGGGRRGSIIRRVVESQQAADDQLGDCDGAGCVWWVVFGVLGHRTFAQARVILRALTKLRYVIVITIIALITNRVWEATTYIIPGIAGVVVAVLPNVVDAVN
jgi:hypothetical protein